jgi:isoleucyl-tRNA synthetase
MSKLYRKVDPRVSFPQLETAIIERWKADRIFHRSMEEREGSPEWVFYEGPPTANNKPGIHHVEARTFKDIFCRFQTMRGKYVHRKGGWDCHGLPVEIEVEKELGITTKHQIEDLGIEKFVERCRESVQRYVADWERLTERIGFWVDMEDAYWTMSSDYVETVWWILKQIWDKGLLEEDFKVVPYCPRCETALSSHEQHQTDAYKVVIDPSIYVRFPLADDPSTALLIWTTTPWTLLSNMATAVDPEQTYVKVPDPKKHDHFLILAESRVEPLLGEGVKAVDSFAGRDLLERRYVPPFPFVPSGERGHTVRTGDFVTSDDGSGIVHLAPYGEEDMVVGKRDDLPIVQMINGQGRVVAEGDQFAMLWVKDADPHIIADLNERGLLYQEEPFEHSYPHCWRCKTPLLYFARKDWYIRTSQIRAELQASNEETNWQPPTIKYGRFGDWLKNNVDWSLSRDRYWGTPLPIWRCEEGHIVCVGSFAELAELSGNDLTDFDPHRPYVDRITFPCRECASENADRLGGTPEQENADRLGGTPEQEMTRVKSVIDAWFDSGSMPFGQWHYPFENEEIFDKRFPADFISEAIDQTRGWFYSLLAVATLIRGHNSYRNVVCLGHIVDGNGRKMSKSMGNVIDPWTILDSQGADAVRWYLLTGGTPWSPRRMSSEIVEEALRKHLLTLWNTYSFWVTYASLEDFDPTRVDIPVSQRPEMDRWILAELNDTVRVATDALSRFDATRGGQRIERLVDDLSNWYVRRSRRRFWRSGADADTRSAFLTLWECLVTIAQLTAPYTPFIADEIYTNLMSRSPGAPDSVHLSDWPAVTEERDDEALRARMDLVRRLVTLGRSARTEAKVRVRQPLARALVVMPTGDADLLEGLRSLVAEELNVRDVEIAGRLEELVTYSVKPNFRALGPRLGKRVKDVAAALARVDAHELVTTLENTGSAHVDLDGEMVELTRDELDVRVEGRAGFSLAREGAYGVALDVEIGDDLLSEGIAREVIRGVQELRKTAGLSVEDRIRLRLATSDEVIAGALRTHADLIATEVLATSLEWDGNVPGDAAREEIKLDQGTVVAALERA